MYFEYVDDPKERVTVAKFNDHGKLIEYNAGYISQFSSDLIALACKKVLKSMIV